MQVIKKISAGKLLVPYLLLALIFSQVFGCIEKYYLKPDCLCVKGKDYPIDLQVMKTGHFFDKDFVVNEGRKCYDKAGYFHTFFPVDMVFPFVYSLLMFSMINLSRLERGKVWLANLIRLGAVFDYGEDFCFARFLRTDNEGYAGATAIFTTLKTVLIVINALTCLYVFFRWTVMQDRRR